MNVTCENCQRRYVVPDEKLQDRSVRLRCKGCQQVIEVALPPAPPAPGGAAAANPWDDEPTRAAPALDKKAQWFAMVKGQQVGPLPLPALQTKVHAGEVKLGTFLWREGLDGWRRAEELPELLPLFAAPKKAGPPVVVAAPEPDPRPALAGLFDDDERTVLRPRRPKPQPSASAPQVAAQPEPEDEEEAYEDEVAPRGSRTLRVVLVLIGLLALAGAAAVFLRV